MVAHVSHILGARKLAEQLFRSLPDFGPPPLLPPQTTNQETNRGEIQTALRRQIEELNSRGLLSADTVDVVLSHPLIARFAAQLLTSDPSALQSLVVDGEIRKNPLVDLIEEDLTRRAQSTTIEPMLELETPLSWSDEADLIGYALQEGTISKTEAMYALCDHIALQQLRRVLRLHKALENKSRST